MKQRDRWQGNVELKSGFILKKKQLCLKVLVFPLIILYFNVVIFFVGIALVYEDDETVSFVVVVSYIRLSFCFSKL